MSKLTLDGAVEINIILDEEQISQKKPNDYEQISDYVSAVHSAIGLVADLILIKNHFSIGMSIVNSSAVGLAGCILNISYSK